MVCLPYIDSVFSAILLYLSPMLRIPFHQVFKENEDGTLTPLRAIHVNGVTFGQGVSFGKGVSIGGVNFFDYKGLDIAAEEQNGVLSIKGFFKS